MILSAPVTMLSHQSLLFGEPAQEADRGFQEVIFFFSCQLWIRMSLGAGVSMGPQLLEEGSKTAGDAADCGVTLFVQEGSVVERRAVQIAANNAEGERGHVCVAVALPVRLAVRHHIHRHLKDLMVLFEAHVWYSPVLTLWEVCFTLLHLLLNPGVADLQMLGEERLRIEVTIAAVAVFDRGGAACGFHDLFAVAGHKPLEVADVHIVLLVEEDDAFKLVEAVRSSDDAGPSQHHPVAVLLLLPSVDVHAQVVCFFKLQKLVSNVHGPYVNRCEIQTDVKRLEH